MRSDGAQVAVAPDYRVFALFALLNRYGYDLEGNPEMHPVRLRVRAAFAAVPPVAAELELVNMARPFWPRVYLMEAFALFQDRWPAGGPGTGDLRFGTGEPTRYKDWLAAVSAELPEPVEPAFVAGLPALGDVLAGFEARTPLGELWREYLPDHLQRSAEMVCAVVRGLHASMSALGLSGWPFRRIKVITNLLQSEWLADQFVLGDQLTAVVASADPSLAPSVLHEALHIVFRPPLASDVVRAVLRKWEERAEPIRRKMEPQGYWGVDPATGLYRAVQEAMVRAATIVIGHRDKTPEDRALRIKTQAERGFELVPPLAAYFAARESGPLRPDQLAEALDRALFGLLANPV